MSQYLYCDRDLFLQPESYEYAKCEGQDFFDSWLKIRQSKIKKIVEFAANSSTSSQNTTQGQEISLSEGDSSLTNLLLSAGENLDEPNQVKWIIDELVKKYEIFKRLYSAYSRSINRLPDAKAASLNEYLMFAQVLANYSEKYDNLQYLSTLLKLLDVLCSLSPDAFDVSQAQQLNQLYQLEKKLVLNWEDNLKNG